jgi:drug/metabolite transporter (DMT)-like permease
MIEKILGIGLLIGIVVRDFLGLDLVIEQPILICGTSLAIIYLVANWWTNKPSEKTTRTILITFLYGLTSSCLTFTLLFKLLYLSGSDQLTVLSYILIIFTLAMDLVSSKNKVKIINRLTIWRLVILTSIVTILFFVPEDYRVSITYKKYPDFINYYELNKDTYNFIEISVKYFNKDRAD